MPYERKGKCVYKKSTGEKVGCSDTVAKAKKYIQALYASELNENLLNTIISNKKMINKEKLREIIKNTLTQSLQEKKKFPDLTGDGKVTKADILKGRGVELKEGSKEHIGGKMDIDEDLDLGHQDDEPHMIKGDLYRIGKYALELYQMIDQFDKMKEEVDFPHWWQAKIIKAKSMIVSAKHYLDFELKEPQIDAIVGTKPEGSTETNIE